MPLTPVPCHRVVAVVLTHADRLCLLRRSREVGSDTGRWHCVTGFLPFDTDPRDQALAEVREETGLDYPQLGALVAGNTLQLPDASGHPWTVFTFSCEVTEPHLRINWEHDAYAWVPRPAEGRDLVPWLHDVVAAVA